MGLCNNRNNSDIVIVQGDTLQKNVSITGIESMSVIEGVYFSCNRLNLSKKLDFDASTNKFLLVISSAETEDFKAIVTDYDVTVKFFDEKIKTALYRGTLTVLEKTNPVGGF